MNAIRRASLVAGLALLMSFATAMPASAAFVPVSHDLGGGPIKVDVSTHTEDGARARLIFSISGIPEPKVIGITSRYSGLGEVGRNETIIGLTSTKDLVELEYPTTFAYQFGLTSQPEKDGQPAGTSIADRYGALIQDLAFSKGQNVISGSIELTYDATLGKWAIKNMLLSSPDGRVRAVRLGPADQPQPYLNNDGKTYLSVLVQSVSENCAFDGPNDMPQPDANGYVPCGFYHVAVPIIAPAAPGLSLIPLLILLGLFVPLSLFLTLLVATPRYRQRYQ